MTRYYPGSYTVFPPDTIYFVTITVIDWVDVFIREEYKKIIVESLDYCRRNKGLQLHAWVLMTNHIHFIASHQVDSDHLWSVIRDFKRHTSKKVIAAVNENPSESRKKWLLEHFKEENIMANDDASCSISKNGKSQGVGNEGLDTGSQHYHLWQRGYDKYCIYNIKHLRQKMDYLHANPVRAGIVFKPWEYRYSSCPNYAGEDGVIELDLINLGLEDSTKPAKW